MKILLVCFAAILLIPVGFAATSNWLENFESCIPPETPGCPGTPEFNGQDFYTYSNVGTGVFRTTVSHALGNISYLYNDTSVTEDDEGKFTFDVTDFNWNIVNNPDSRFEIAFMFQEFPDSGQQIGIDLRISSDASSYCGIRVSSAGAVVAETQASATPTTATIPITLSLFQWYNLTIRDVNDAPSTDASCTYYFPNQDIVSTVAQTSANFVVGDHALRVGELFSGTGGTGRHGAVFFDNLRIVNGPFNVTTAGADATAAVTGLVGFDVDEQATGIIARTNSGDFVRGFAPFADDGSLDQRGVQETNCTISHGVLASGDALAFTSCGADTILDSIEIRDFNPSNQPEFAADCEPGACDTSVDFTPPCFTGDFDDDQTIRNIKNVQIVGFDYSLLIDQDGQNEIRGVAFAYTSTTGHVGVLEYTSNSGTCDTLKEERIQYSGAGNEPDEICSYAIASGRQFIGAVDSISTSRFYEYDVDTDTGTFGEFLDGTLTQQNGPRGPYGGSLSGAIGVSCAFDRALYVTSAASDNIRMVDVANDTTLWTATSTNEKNRGVWLSGNAQWALWADGSVVYIAHANNGSIIGSLIMPSGTFFGIRTSGSANDAWIATDTTIAWYNLLETFPEIPFGTSGGGGSGGGVSPTPTGILPSFGGAAGNTNNPIGQVIFAVNQAWGFDTTWLWGLAVLAIFLSKVWNRAAFILYLVAFIGTCICVAIGLFPFWVIPVTVFLIIAFAGHNMFGNRSGGAA